MHVVDKSPDSDAFVNQKKNQKVCDEEIGILSITPPKGSIWEICIYFMCVCVYLYLCVSSSVCVY